MQVKNENSQSRMFGDNTSSASAQLGDASLVDISLFEQALRMRLEIFALDASTPLEHYQNQDMQSISEYLETTLLELRYLLNECRLLTLLQETA